MKEFTVEDHLKEELKDPYFRETYELEKQKFAIVRKIIEYRIKNKVNQSQLAKMAGVSQQHISKIENGIFSSMLTLEKVLLCIGMTVKIKAVSLDPRTRSRVARAIKNRR